MFYDRVTVFGFSKQGVQFTKGATVAIDDKTFHMDSAWASGNGEGIEAVGAVREPPLHKPAFIAKPNNMEYATQPTFFTINSNDSKCGYPVFYDMDMKPRWRMGAVLKLFIALLSGYGNIPVVHS